jgi:nicotinamide-nucleotide amidase
VTDVIGRDRKRFAVLEIIANCGTFRNNRPIEICVGANTLIAETLSVGTELLLGQTVDTNASYLARVLSDLGISLYYRGTVGDNPDRMREALGAAFARADVVITIGGLGPTMDDLTKEIVCSVLEVDMAVDPDQEQRLKDLAARRGYRYPPSFLKQALMPAPPYGRVVPNPVGTAPGIWVEKAGKIAVSLPGPPNELIPMVEQSVIPWLAEKLGADRLVIKSQILRIIGIGESVAEETVKDLITGENPTVAPYAKLGECHLRITARANSEPSADALIAPVEAEIRRRLGAAVYGINDQTLEYATVQLLRELNLSVSTAESCTGGLVAQRITSVPGASDIFSIGFVTYSNDAKTAILGVSPETLAEHGAVSPETAEGMAIGARASAESDFALAVTGIAGPGGGAPDKPVGLVYIALAQASGVTVSRNLYGGSRDDVRRRSSHSALAMLRDAALQAAKPRPSAESSKLAPIPPGTTA